MRGGSISFPGRAAAVVVAVVLTLVPSPSGAGPKWVTDADDAKGFLDIRAVSHGHAEGARLKHTLTTYRRWRSRDLWCGAVRFRFHGLRRDLIVAYRKGLLAVMLNSRTREGIGAPKVFRPTKRRVAVTFPRRWLGRGIESYEWSARTVRHGEKCPERGGDVSKWIRDRAPAKRRILHQL